MFIKICGITRRKDYEFLLEKNISAAGFIAYPKSKRYISPGKVKDILEAGGNILKVGVFVDADTEDILSYIEAGINIIQLHGSESPEFSDKLSAYAEVWKAFRPVDMKDISCNIGFPAAKVLIDAYSEKGMGGTGTKADWDIAAAAVRLFEKPVILAGGLNASNIKEAISKVMPWGVDISSGVESSPGIKDLSEIEKILSLIRKQE